MMPCLLQWQDMPKHLQFNPYIHTGYRPILSVWGSIASLFYFHNETVNILSHGLPIVYILTVVPKHMPWESSVFLSWCHIAGSVAPWVGSFTYHLFMNLHLGESCYYRLLQLDMLGIWISQSFGALPMVRASVYCLPYFLQWLVVASYAGGSVLGLIKAMNAWSPWKRRLCFATPFLMRSVLCILRYSRFGGGHPDSFIHCVMQDVLSLLGGAIGAMRVPEKWFPGRLDLYFNSHNIMHVLVVCAVYSMYRATVQDLQWMAHGQCTPPHFPLPHDEL
ncbi:progestin and adipoQ receptor family member 4 [Macrosteles quadrilineatus]|uniref:progestin and adipoQ receptor family member 4 n=1 Tax=Macrosteles quadrilineatus TaxID=74068 RepID=UPI0023E1E8AB|nr:progestin and adipoQ receptor family member 4 [Macrosteles quadrilineatus]